MVVLITESNELRQRFIDRFEVLAMPLMVTTPRMINACFQQYVPERIFVDASICTPGLIRWLDQCDDAEIILIANSRGSIRHAPRSAIMYIHPSLEPEDIVPLLPLRHDTNSAA